MYEIRNIRPGTGDYQSQILYAELWEIGGKQRASATVEFILQIEYYSLLKVVNYREALFKYIEFNEGLRKRRSRLKHFSQS